MVKELLTLFTMLSDRKDFTVDEIATRLGKTPRTIYRTLDEMRTAGYVIESNKGRPYIVSSPRQYIDVNQVLYFTAEEGQLLSHLLMQLDGNNPLKQSLLNKLLRVIDHCNMPLLTTNSASAHAVSTIQEAMEQRQQVILVDYASHNGATGNRLVEPCKWSANYRQFHAYDLGREGMRIFVVGRIGHVELTHQKWLFEDRHLISDTDCFWNSGTEWHEVTLRMNDLALSLLHEEYPLSETYQVEATGDANRPYHVTLRVLSPKGIGRFVRGLSDCITIVRGLRYDLNTLEFSE